MLTKSAAQKTLRLGGGSSRFVHHMYSLQVVLARLLVLCPAKRASYTWQADGASASDDEGAPPGEEAIEDAYLQPPDMRRATRQPLITCVQVLLLEMVIVLPPNRPRAAPLENAPLQRLGN